MTQKIKKAFQEIDLPDKITWVTDSWMLWSPKEYFEGVLSELEKCNKKREKEIVRELRRLYKALKKEEDGGRD